MRSNRMSTIPKANEYNQTNGQFGRNSYEFELNIDIRKTRRDNSYEGSGKSTYEVEWIERDGPPMTLIEINGVRLKKEISFYVESIRHCRIVRTFGFVKSPNPDSIMFLQEEALQGNLLELLHRNEFTPVEKVLWEIFIQISDGMTYLSEQGITHGNLTCRNVLVFQMNPLNPKKNSIKLADFGFTKSSNLYKSIDSNVKTTINMISARYSAPELLDPEKKPQYSEKSDVYSMGILMWQASQFGSLPYSNLTHDEDIRQMKFEDKRLARPPLCSEELWVIINNCWHFKSKLRPYFDEIKDSLIKLSEEKIEPVRHSVPLTRPTNVASHRNRTDSLRDFDYKDCQENTDVFIDYQNYLKSSSSHENCDADTTLAECPFCKESFNSSIDTRQHFLQCGTKTEQCPNCAKFIQRSFFTYHYENNCADVTKSQSFSSCTLDPQETINCEFCQNPCDRNDYNIHQEHCLKNTKRKQPSSGAIQRLNSEEFVVVSESTIPQSNIFKKNTVETINLKDSNSGCCCCS